MCECVRALAGGAIDRCTGHCGGVRGHPRIPTVASNSNTSIIPLTNRVRGKNKLDNKTSRFSDPHTHP